MDAGGRAESGGSLIEVRRPTASPTVLKTPRMTLRPLTATDRDEFLRVVALSREAVSRWIPFGDPGETDADFFQRQLRMTEEADHRRHALRRVGVLEDGRIAGGFNLNAITRGLDWQADAVWWVASDQAGRGLATEGLRALLEHAFSDLPAGLGLHAVHAGIEPGNEPSRRVAEKCGFVQDPLMRSHLKVGERWAVHDFFIARCG